MKDKDREKDLLLKAEVNGDSSCVLELSDSNESFGYVIVDINDEDLRIHDFVLGENVSETEKKFFLDFLMRAAASYGENRNAKRIITVRNSWNDFLKTKGFETDENHAFAPMSLIVHYN
ncbi:MAG: hypothetical protein Q4C42_05950 [Clostridia bacterium]|nr:hypothetical protein [Clostridia bacterium]